MSEEYDLNDPHGRLKLTTEQVDVVLQTLKWEQEQLGLLSRHHEEGKYPFIKSAIAIFSLFITGMITLITLASKFNINIFAIEEYYALFSIVVVGMCAINLGLIKYIIWKRAEGIKTVRQINCNRQAIDSILFHSLQEGYPQTEQMLGDTNTVYWKVLGKHRKLETNNDPLREGQADFFKSLPLSPDNFMVLVITTFTFLSLLMPNVLWLLNSGTGSKILAYVSGVISVVFLIIVIGHVRSSQNMIKKALESKKDKQRVPGERQEER